MWGELVLENCLSGAIVMSELFIRLTTVARIRLFTRIETSTWLPLQSSPTYACYVLAEHGQVQIYVCYLRRTTPFLLTRAQVS